MVAIPRAEHDPGGALVRYPHRLSVYLACPQVPGIVSRRVSPGGPAARGARLPQRTSGLAGRLGGRLVGLQSPFGAAALPMNADAPANYHTSVESPAT